MKISTMNKAILFAGACFITAGCATDGRSPHVGVGVSMGGNPSPPVASQPTQKENGPPPWAPAHGRRAKEVVYKYYYYPSTGVYFNVSTGSYFYLNGGAWQMAMTLPSTVSIDANEYVTVELDTDRPYLYYAEHKVKYKQTKQGGAGHGKGPKTKKGHWNKD